MYSRASSPESLASCDIQDGYKDAYSSYEQSRATSGRVSPSDLPDSPCQSRPYSPPKSHLSNKKHLQSTIIPSCSFPYSSASTAPQNVAQSETTVQKGKEHEPTDKKKAAENEEFICNIQGGISQRTLGSQNEEECKDDIKIYTNEGETPAGFSKQSSNYETADYTKYSG